MVTHVDDALVVAHVSLSFLSLFSLPSHTPRRFTPTLHRLLPSPLSRLPVASAATPSLCLSGGRTGAATDGGASGRGAKLPVGLRRIDVAPVASSALRVDLASHTSVEIPVETSHV